VRGAPDVRAAEDLRGLDAIVAHTIAKATNLPGVGSPDAAWPFLLLDRHTSALPSRGTARSGSERARFQVRRTYTGGSWKDARVLEQVQRTVSMAARSRLAARKTRARAS
jgi:hypothetical protein